ncbi:MAG: tape measure protein, partial [Desulfobacteraceae bacterium]|nr:tape measure protein [Desulfobacteraceae bacterium]
RETPFQIEEIIDAFIKMKAGGLDPSIETMRILGDTASALGGEKETFEGIARALAQMATKGKASAEEFLQLQERGVPAMEILKEKLGLTAEQIANIGRESVNAKTAIRAILEGLEERFGGQMEKIAETWAGIVAELKSLWRDFLLLIGESGFFDEIKSTLNEFRKIMREAFETGEVKVWARNISDTLVSVIKAIKFLSSVLNALEDSWRIIRGTAKTFTEMNEEALSLWENIKNLSKAFKDMVESGLKAVDDLAGGLGRSFANIVSDAFGSGKALITNFVDGIKSVASGPINAVKSLLARVRAHLPSSPAKEGPLSDLDKVGPGFVKTISDGIRKTEPVLINEMERITAILNKVRNLSLSTSELLARGPGNIAGDMAARTSIFSSSLSEREKAFAFEQVSRAGQLRSDKFERAQDVRSFDATSGTNLAGSRSISNSSSTVNFNLALNSSGGSSRADASDIDRQLADLWKGNRSQLRRAMAR